MSSDERFARTKSHNVDSVNEYDYHHTVSPDKPLRQGDVIKVYNKQTSQYQRWLVTLTADCDFAQKKNSGIVTCLGIMTAKEFLDKFFAPDLLDTLATQVKQQLSDEVWSIDKKRTSTVKKLQPKTIRVWLEQSGIEGFCEELGVEGKRKTNIVQLSKQFLFLTDPSKKNDMSKVKEYWKLVSKKTNAIQNEICHALTKDAGMDCLFIPTLPKEHGIGFVIHLRNIISLPNDQILFSTYDTHIRDVGSTSQYLRIGRFSDPLRYFIAQRAMQVFSRIGLDSFFEVESGEALTLLAEEYGYE